MSRHRFASAVIALTLASAGNAYADDEPVPAPTPPKVDAPTAPKVDAPKVPVVAAPVVAPAAAKPAAETPKAAAAAPTPPPAAAPAPAPAPKVEAKVETAAAPKVETPPETPKVEAKEKPKAEPATELALRPSKPLTLDTDQGKMSWGYKGLFFALVAAGGFFAWKRKRGTLLGAPKAPAHSVRVLGRTAMGLRGEIALIEAGGMRVLVGVTPTAMQTLAVLPDDGLDVADDAADAERARALFATPKDLGPPIPARVATFAANRYADDAEPPKARAEAPRARASEAPRTPVLARAASEAPRALEGQARGLALALGKHR